MAEEENQKNKSEESPQKESEPKKKSTTTEESKTGLVEILKTSFLILVLLGVVILLYFGALRYRAEMYHTQVLKSLNSGQVNLEQLQNWESNAVNLISFEDRYRRILSQVYLLRIDEVMNGNLSQTQKRSKFQDLMGKAVNQAQQAVKISDHDVTNWANQGSIYQKLMDYGVQGADQWAIKSYEKAIELAPNNPAFHTQLARVYITKANVSAQGKKKKEARKNLDQAEQHLDKALKIKSNYWPAHFQQAIVYDQRGKLGQAITKLKNLKKVQPKDQSVVFRLGMLYWRKGSLGKAERELKDAVALSPNFSNARYFLGLVYDKQGEKQKAIKQFEKIASVSSANAQRVQRILNNLRAGKPALQQQTGPSQQMPKLEGEGNPTTTAPQQ